MCPSKKRKGGLISPCDVCKANHLKLMEAILQKKGGKKPSRKPRTEELLM